MKVSGGFLNMCEARQTSNSTRVGKGGDGKENALIWHNEIGI